MATAVVGITLVALLWFAFFAVVLGEMASTVSDLGAPLLP
jgi:hypothetical protein